MAAATIPETPTFSIGNFLAQEREKDILRFSTAGSVDDGKSTLIGRLLYDTQSVYDDQVRSIEGKGTTAPGQIDFALLTDGLRAEREQGITIDVAYRYFSTLRRKFIIADTPGHEQYTRNMATGASTADAAVVLIDARKGVLVQSRRHAYIASLLGVRHIVVAVNKMDLVEYSEAVFREIEREFTGVLAQIAARTGTANDVHFVPVSALAGDNVVHASVAMPWYRRLSLLQLLESLPVRRDVQAAPFRLAVQRVVRPNQSFRGFAGQIASGTVLPGDRILALPSGHSANVTRIVTYDGDLSEAQAPLSVTLVLDRELDISRGDLLVAAEAPATISHGAKASLVWMDQRPLLRDHRYLLKHTSQTVPVVISTLEHRTDVGTLKQEPAETLEMNGIGTVRLQFLRPIALDRYAENRTTGGFILMDPETNGTVAAGMVTEPLQQQRATHSSIAANLGRVTAEERRTRWGHLGGVLALAGPCAWIDRIERLLFVGGAVTVRSASAEQAALLAAAGVLALVVLEREGQHMTAHIGERIITTTLDEAEGAVRKLLAEAGIVEQPSVELLVLDQLLIGNRTKGSAE